MDSNLILALILIVAGFLLLGVELVIPTGGIFFIVSVASLIVGVVFTFLHNATVGVAVMLGVFVAFPLVLSVLVHYAPRTPMRRLLLLSNPEDHVTMATTPVNQELEQLRGRYGKTLSTLRPAGVVDFDGRRIDSITEGMMVDAGQWVRCVDVQAGRVVVRPAEKPKLDALESADFG
jgi:membrane-bound serine protease (ClpP class)